VLRTRIPAGVPISAGTSKDSVVMMNASSAAASRLGATSRNVTLQRTRMRPAPLTAAACSSAGSAMRRLGAISRYIAGKRIVDWMKIIAGIVKMSIVGKPEPNQLCTVALTKLELGPINRIQPIAWITVGTPNDTITVKYVKRRNGTFVRSVRNATNAAASTLTTALPAANSSVFTVAVRLELAPRMSR
jgi:hypothetical protein